VDSDGWVVGRLSINHFDIEGFRVPKMAVSYIKYLRNLKSEKGAHFQKVASFSKSPPQCTQNTPQKRS
jgi:hypothetical protein